MSMELDHSFTVPVPPDQAWNVLLDVEKIAPCMPGAQVDTVDGDDVAGRLKVKVGPVSLTYKGTATFKDRDTADRSVVVEASGKELRGAGTASATVRAALRPEEGSDSATLVTLHTTLNVTGRPAQFGRGVIAEVGSRLIDKFADNLAKELANGGAATATAPDGAASAPGTEASPGSSASASAPAAAEGSAPASAPEAVGGAGSAGEPLSAPTSAPASEAAPAPASPAASAPAASAAAAASAPSAAARGPVTSAPASGADQEDSLNLLSLVGPVIIKRLAPVAGAVAAVGVLTWGVRRMLRRRKSA
jgi:carbon monoxide dehydrogenase subunit G